MKYNEYKSIDTIRKVYKVEITYKNRESGLPRIYYVDTTTGEVIGGENIFDSDIIE